MDWALGLDRVGWGQEGVVIGWVYEIPAWGWVLIALLAVGLSVWSYSRMLGPLGARMGLAVFRAVLLLVIAAVLAGPMLVLRRDDIEPDWLLMLVDRSASMQIKDMHPDSAGGGSGYISRDEALRGALDQHADLFGENQLGQDHRLLWLGFDANIYPVEPFGESGDSLGESYGRTTALRTAIEQALSRAGGRPVSGVVVFTDGRSPQSTGVGLIRRLGQHAVGVFPVPLGSAQQPIDLSLAQVDAPDRAFVNDTVPVTVWIDHYPADADVAVEHVRVRLVDPHTGEVIDEASPGAGGLREPVRLMGESAVAGPVTWRVELEYDPPPASAESGRATYEQRELITDNNSREIDLELIDRQIRVLYVEGYPRWDYRYLKNVLMREESINSSIMLISADRGFTQEGDLPITRLPRDAQELKPFDVVIIGDVPSDYMSLQQRSLLRDHVAINGAGLLWIGGAHYTPYSYDTTQLADLLPMGRPGMTELADPTQGPLRVEPTPLAKSLNILTLWSPGAPGQEEDLGGDARPAWPTNLPGLRWAQVLGPLKPSVEVLATALPQKQGSSIPILMRMRYGAGQVLYVATDDTWRWRYGRGDHYFQQFWVQLIRMLGRHRVQGNSQGVQLRVSHRRVEQGQTVVVELHVSDAMILQRDLPSIAVSITRSGSAHHGGPQNDEVIERIELRPQPPDGAPVPADLASPGRRVYKALWQPDDPGQLVLRVSEPVLSDLGIAQPIEVIHPDDELRQPLPDHARLAALAQQSGGVVVPLNHLDKLAGLIPNRARRTPNDIREPLWDSPLTLILVLGLLTVEWIGRKILRLV